MSPPPPELEASKPGSAQPPSILHFLYLPLQIALPPISCLRQPQKASVGSWGDRPLQTLLRFLWARSLDVELHTHHTG